MVGYTKPWLSLEEQVTRLASRGVDVGPRDRARSLLSAVGYYRLTGYLYPFRCSEQYGDANGHEQTRILSEYRPGTSIDHAARLIDFDWRLRMLVMDGIERVEVAVRMQVGYVLGYRSPFAHLDIANFTSSFTELRADAETGEELPSNHDEGLRRVKERRDGSDEAFVAHFRDKHDDQMPIWALTEILELGHLARLYRGLNQSDAEEIAGAFGVPTKKVMVSWLASLNYVRNVAAHHARLFNRKLQYAPGRPRKGAVRLLDHMRDEQTAKSVYGLYNALAVIAYLLRSIDSESGWCQRLVALVHTFPATPALSVRSLGFPDEWATLELWRTA